MFKPLKTLAISAVLALAGSTSSAHEPSASVFGLNPACAASFGVAAKGLWIFGSPLESEALKISDVGTSARFSGIESKLLNVTARNGLMRLLDFEKGRSLVINFLLKTGVVKAEHRDPFYPMLILASENVAVDLRKTHHDPAVDMYLKASNLSKKAKLDGVEPILQPRSKEAAKAYFYWEILKALDVIQDSDTRSRDVVVAIFTEVGRARDRSMGNEAAYLAQVETILESVTARAHYVRTAFSLPTLITSAIAEIPFGDPILQSLLMLYSKVFERNRELRTQDLDPSSPHPGFQMVDGSFRLLFTNRDLLRLKDITNSFYATYCERTSANLFSPQFADALEAAYPELQLVRHKKGVISNHSERDLYLPDSQFGPVTFEGYKIIYRAALFLSILRGDASVLSELTPTQFQALRRNMIAELDLTYSGPIKDMRGRFDREKIDLFMTFFFMDALGKGRDPFLDALDTEHQISKGVGSDYERRAKKFLEKYRLSSYSIARLSNENQDTIMRWLGLNYEFNAGQVIQMEASSHGLNALAEASVGDLSAVYYRALISFAAIPTVSPNIVSSQTLTARNFSRWEVLGNLMHRLGRRQITPVQLHDTFSNAAAQGRGLPNQTTKERTIVKLSYLTETTDSREAALVKEVFESLPQRDQNLLITMSELPILMTGATGITGAFKVRIKNQKDAIRQGLLLLSHVTHALEIQSDFQQALVLKEDGEIRLQLRDVARRVLEIPEPIASNIELQIEPLSRGNFRIYPR